MTHRFVRPTYSGSLFSPSTTGVMALSQNSIRVNDADSCPAVFQDGAAVAALLFQ
jgi:hypothetical protein